MSATFNENEHSLKRAYGGRKRVAGGLIPVHRVPRHLVHPRKRNGSPQCHEAHDHCIAAWAPFAGLPALYRMACRAN